jgi:hypothetical protein
MVLVLALVASAALAGTSTALADQSDVDAIAVLLAPDRVASRKA